MKENLLLAALPRKEREFLDPHFEHVTLDQGEVLIEAEEPIKYILFPYDLVTSTIQVMSDGAQIEVGLMGIEGIVGFQFWLRQKTTPFRTIVQIPGTGLKIKSGAVHKEFMQGGQFHDLVLRYVHALFTQASQTAVCNRLHSVEARLARWLLTVRERVEADQFPITHDFMAMMLGANRATSRRDTRTFLNTKPPSERFWRAERTMGRNTKAGATILLVDDVDEYRNLIKRGLELRGFRVKTAYDELDAVDRARYVCPDVILLEMGRMPSLQTLDLGRRIRADARVGDQVKIVVYADCVDETVSEGGEVRLGPNEYVILPEDGEQFESFLGRLLTE